MKIWSPSTEVRINGNYGTTPDMASIWFAGNGNNNGGGYGSSTASVYINLSPSIPSCYVGFEIQTSINNEGNNAWSQISFIAGYGVNAGGASLSPNNQNYDWYTNNSESPYGSQSYPQFGYESANRRFAVYYQNLNTGGNHCVYGRVISLYISYITISWVS